jgi:hypothetical protein
LEDIGKVSAGDAGVWGGKGAVIAGGIKATDVEPRAHGTGSHFVSPAFIFLQWVSFPSTDGTLEDPLPTLLVLALMTLLGEAILGFDPVVLLAGFAGSEALSIG